MQTMNDAQRRAAILIVKRAAEQARAMRAAIREANREMKLDREHSDAPVVQR